MHWSSSLKIARVAKNTSLLCLHPASIFHPTTRFLSTSARTTKNMLVYRNPTRGMISHSGPWTKIVEYVRPCNTPRSPRERFSACWSGKRPFVLANVIRYIAYLKPRSQRTNFVGAFLERLGEGIEFRKRSSTRTKWGENEKTGVALAMHRWSRRLQDM